jgi:hypothetical protein
MRSTDELKAYGDLRRFIGSRVNAVSLHVLHIFAAGVGVWIVYRSSKAVLGYPSVPALVFFGVTLLLPILYLRILQRLLRVFDATEPPAENREAHGQAYGDGPKK